MSRKEVRVCLAEKRPVREAAVCRLAVSKCVADDLLVSSRAGRIDERKQLAALLLAPIIEALAACMSACFSFASSSTVSRAVKLSICGPLRHRTGAAMTDATPAEGDEVETRVQVRHASGCSSEILDAKTTWSARIDEYGSDPGCQVG